MKKDYILGTEKEERDRLGLQHQVWSAEARRGWEIADFSAGHTILDLGCGPGFCSVDLAYLVGREGKVIAVDKSQSYIDFLTQSIAQHDLPIVTQCADFMEMKLQANSLDGVFSRWALAWVSDVGALLEKITGALKPGAAFVAHEYYDWSTFQTEPYAPNLSTGIKAVLKSFKSLDSEIDIGRELPGLFYAHGLEVISIRPMTKLATAESLSWHWPKSFLNIFLPKTVDMGLLSEKVCKAALKELEELEYHDGATILCPQMVEVIGVRGG